MCCIFVFPTRRDRFRSSLYSVSKLFKSVLVFLFASDGWWGTDVFSYNKIERLENLSCFIEVVGSLNFFIVKKLLSHDIKLILMMLKILKTWNKFEKISWVPALIIIFWLYCCICLPWICTEHPSKFLTVYNCSSYNDSLINLSFRISVTASNTLK